MKLKILTIGTLVLLSGILSYAQGTAQTSLEPSLFLKGGFNLSNITINKNGDLDNNKTLPSFQVGLQGDLPIGPFFAIQPGIFFTGKGAKVESGNTSGDNWYRATNRPYYIEIPVNAVIKLPLGNQSSFFFGAGPYVGIGITGNNKVEGQVGGVSFSRTQSIKFSNDDPFTPNTEEGSGYNIVRRFDYGLNGTVGIQAKFALISVNYGYGLAKIQSGTNSSEDDLGKYRVLSFTVGFKL
jgi:hypothetical protein